MSKKFLFVFNSCVKVFNGDFMQISNVSGTNFGMLDPSNITLFGRIRISAKNRAIIRSLIEGLNKDAAKRLTVGMDIGRPQALNHQISIKLRAYPQHGDFSVLKAMRPGVEPIDYRGRSRWVPITNPYLLEEMASFLNKHARYIRYCTTHQDHAQMARIAVDPSKKLANKIKYHA